MKMVTVIGIIGKTHGVKRVMNPQNAAVAMNTQKPICFLPGGGSWFRTAFRSASWSWSAERRRPPALAPVSVAGSAVSGVTAVGGGPAFPVSTGLGVGNGVGGSFGPRDFGGAEGGGPADFGDVGAAGASNWSTLSRYFSSIGTGVPDTTNVASTGTALGARHRSLSHTRTRNRFSATFRGPGLAVGDTTALNSKVAPSG